MHIDGKAMAFKIQTDSHTKKQKLHDTRELTLNVTRFVKPPIGHYLNKFVNLFDFSFSALIVYTMYNFDSNDGNHKSQRTTPTF